MSKNTSNKQPSALADIFSHPEFKAAASIHSQVGDSGYTRIITAFLNGIKEELNRLESLEIMRQEEKRQLFHKVAGAASAVGAAKLEAISRSMEAEILNHPTISTEPLTLEIKTTIALLEKHLVAVS
ncbi:Uncharacterised protein [Zhongshania aliphaticivorans]|uniref:Uncharacterized protein n=1 Tax=Zhongshania aliphaticivorans TaxID=1470434 RepID=A0A5S9N5W8_9GAMM|nr:Hpt domain-containing protein [Zhongshania aliphaticivorans]CAA0082227.1 Uncharacterised protein [Zhongshania aliphaticivorans]CAA0084489.1 Uncharacterised protein [Zhongshania aliphaticivorans]